MTIEERQEWLRLEEEEKHRTQQILESGDRMRELSEKIARDIRNNRRNVRRIFWRQRKDKLRARFDRLHFASIDLRFRIAGSWLLLPSERSKRFYRQLELDNLLETLNTDWAKQEYSKIKSGELLPLTLETSGMQVYNSGARHYFIIDKLLNKAAAQEYLSAFSGFRDPDSGKLGRLIGFIEGPVEVTIEARDLLKDVAVAIYRAGTWQSIS